MKLLFVYNANSNSQAKLLDGIHKVLSPSTYACSLCSLTHGSFSERKAWKHFRESSGMEMEFIYKDQFMERFAAINGLEPELPVIFQVEQGKMEVLCTAANIRAFPDVESLISALIRRVENR